MLNPINVRAKANILIIIVPLTLLDSLAPIWAPDIAAIDRVSIERKLLDKFPLTK